ncbi:MAG TPA: hypothetical protein VGW32_03790 [Pyrinomonadaceae bacterium]|nr:hypothetical protein [Pyrinomonadaceae bacterium]
MPYGIQPAEVLGVFVRGPLAPEIPDYVDRGESGGTSSSPY